MKLSFIKKLSLAVAGATLLALPVFTPTHVAAVDESAKTAACQGIGAVGADCDGANSGSSVENIVATVVNILSWIIGVAAVIMLIIGGFRYVVSGGDANSVSGAKNTILYALVGLVVAALAQGLVQFVLRRATTSEAPPAESRLVIPREAA